MTGPNQAAYGEVTGGSGSLSQEFDFAGQQTDGTGLQYLRARYYDPATGTFLSREPLARSSGWLGNNTSYAGASPARFIDPSGLRLCDVETCEGDPALPRGGSRCGPSWNCGTPTPTPPPDSTHKPGAAVACTMTPPYNCSYPRPDTDLFSLIFETFTGEYRATALGLLDLIPLAEACILTGNPFVLGGCVALEGAIGTLAFIETERAIGASNCSENRKAVARAANVSSFLADARQPWGEGFEVIAFISGYLATRNC